MPSMSLQEAMNLAVQHHRAGRLADAEAIYRQVLEISPNQPDVVHLLGILAIQVGKLDVAISVIRRAIELKPTEPSFHANLGEAFMRKGQVGDAIASFRQSLALGPAYEAWNNLGNALNQQGNLDEAIEAFRSAIVLKPKLPEAHSNLGDALKQAGRLEEAMTALDEAIAINPGLMAAHNNRGICLRALGRYQEAIESYRRAIALAPAVPILHYNLAVTLLLKGDYQQGFVEYEHRFGVPELAAAAARFDKPRWDGAELGSATDSTARPTILLHAEQGFGDTIQFVRYARLVQERGARVILAVQPQLTRLMQGIEGIDEVVSLTDPPPPIDLHCPLLSLPRIFGTTPETIPAAPYLKVDEGVANRWAKKLESDTSPLRIAIAWSGRPVFKDDLWRSLTLDALAPLAQVRDATFYSVQVGEAATQAQTPPEGLKLTDLSAELTDFAETAAALLQMHLLITTDTAVAHLGGAMGMPVWLLTSFSPDWRWLLDRDDSPWYPTMRLFRQERIGEWPSVVQRIVSELAQNADKKG